MNPKYLLALLLPFLFYSCKQENDAARGAAPAMGPSQVETYLVRGEVLDNMITTNGNILPNEEVELRSEAAGRIVSLNFKEGAYVKKGQLLLEVDNSELLPNLEKLNSQLKIARQEFGRKKQLLEIEGISREEFEMAELKVANLESDINLLEAQIQKTRIQAPFDGMIGLREVSPGAYVSIGNSIANLVQVNPVKLEFSVPELYAQQMKQGVSIEFKLAGSDKIYKANVFATEPSIDPRTRSLRVRARADNRNGELIPGAFAELSITLDKIPDGMLVPSLAITQDIRGLKVFVIENGVAATKLVKTGIQKNDLVQITEGISPGDTIITTSLLSMRDGMPVLAKSVETNAGVAK